MPSEEFLDSNGNAIVGLIVHNSSTGTNTTVDVGAGELQSKTVTPTRDSQTVLPDSNYDGLSDVTVNGIPNSYVEPYGSITITQNGEYDVSRYATINIGVGNDRPSGGTSSAQAIAYHSITIGDKNTWDDWHLVPTSRPTFKMPSVKTNYVEIPGGDGVIDLTTALTGRPVYSNRQGSFEFLVLNDYGYWANRYSEIANYLAGKEFRAILDDDPEFYYEGRFSLGEWKSEAQWSKVVINYNVGPYKRSLLAAGEMWVWDTFYFGLPNTSEMGDTIPTYRNLIVKGSLTVVYIGQIFESAPVITCSKLDNDTAFSMTVTKGTTTARLTAGTNVLDTISFTEGENTLIFTGTGRVSIENLGGQL